MKHATIIFAALALAACSPPDQQKDDAATAELPPAVARAGCFAEFSRDWSAVGSQYYVIEAEAEGPTCAEATATMRITSRDGVTLFEHSYRTAEVSLAFNPNSNQTGLREELEAWSANTADPQTADTLPAWPARAERPPHFQPEVTRAQYEGARGAQGPLFCYPDGGESNACVALAGDRATLLGSLTPERE
ncbi:MAG TPA: hypothetical protein VFO00_07555 [Vitreimonas sp.]|nr:hypothetical protein [Vitreimonas sp.]